MIIHISEKEMNNLNGIYIKFEEKVVIGRLE